MERIRKNDTVMVIAGKDKGKTGRVIMVFPKENKALVEGVNYVKKHARQTKQNQAGGIIQKEMPIRASNIMPVCKNCGKPVRVGIVISGAEKSRICRKCRETFA